MLNLFVLLFIGLMVYWWGFTQGLFSSFLHLMLVVVAGALSIAVWEPLTDLFLGTGIAAQAGGVALMLPFCLILLIIRLALDKLVPKNMQFPGLVNTIAGGFCGLLAGILVSGIMVIGLGNLAFGAELLGYQPAKISDTGGIDGKAGSGLVVPVDQITGAFYYNLSCGAFHSGQPMSLYRPDLAQEAAVRRLTVDPNASKVATPDAVQLITPYVAMKTPLVGFASPLVDRLGPMAKAEGNFLILVETAFNPKAPTYDSDDAARISPTQVRMVTWSDQSDAMIHAPLAFSMEKDGKREATFIDSSQVSADFSSSATLTWAFMVRAEDKPKFLLLRGLRMPLGEKADDNLAAALPKIGDYKGGSIAALPPDKIVKAGTFQVEAAYNSSLPTAVSRNKAQQMDIRTDEIHKGDVEYRDSGFIPYQARVMKIYTPAHQDMVRVKMSQEMVQTIFGRTMSSSMADKEIRLTGTRGTDWHATGYVVNRKPNTADTNLDIRLVPPTRFKTGREFPIDKLPQGSELYIYFPIDRGAEVAWLKIGDQAEKLNVVAAGVVPVAPDAVMVAKRTASLPAPILPDTLDKPELRGTGPKSIFKGAGRANAAPPKHDAKLTVDSVFVESGEFLRVEITNAQLRRLLDEAFKASLFKGEIVVEDASGQQYTPQGFILSRPDGSVVLDFRTQLQLRVEQLPIADMTGSDKLYLYFTVPPGRVPTVIKYLDTKGNASRFSLKIEP